jgi:septal ring-binding cell division protein DamX
MVPVASPPKVAEGSTESQVCDPALEGGVVTGTDQGMVVPMAEAQGELPGAGGFAAATPERPPGGAGGQQSSPLPEEVLPEAGEVVSMVPAAGEKPMTAATYSRANKKKDKVLSVRKSSRHNKVSVNLSALEKAKRLTADKNLDSGTPHSTSLDSLPDSRLSNVLVDSCILFNPSRGSPCEILDLVRARELAQASIAAAALKKERDEHLAAAREAEVQALSPEEGPMATADPEGVGPSTRSKPKRAYAKRPMLSTRKGRGTRAG